METDELFCIWAGLKKLSISQDEERENPPKLPTLQEEQNKNSASHEPHPLGVQKPDAVSSALDEVLTYPHPAPNVKKGKSTTDMPKHLTSEQMVQYLEMEKVRRRE